MGRNDSSPSSHTSHTLPARRFQLFSVPFGCESDVYAERLQKLLPIDITRLRGYLEHRQFMRIIIKFLPTIGRQIPMPMPTNKRQLRFLAKAELEPTVQVDVWQQAVEQAANKIP
ncbi:hypothetical protein H6G97_38505 [Nostoc flagelliforme FACHB-838]|uniref:Uncharacterized protein n=1 Tax=Nostoc flagelliforme FACHB-838 TaxID=2692904 RepID=A0ABR8E014_9NOSO|nr:hypothetical protein [Nostoc flagelliforme]MBD2535006.1 hypothetical protein [Nostoc flagelliforme FACHB-838]